jgi:nucleoside-diphosphate-sugar epimerase
MRIFLTGATGYIGSAVLDACARAGHAVTALVRNADRLAIAETRGVRTHVADLSAPSSWRAAAEDHDVYIHTAFESSARGPQIDRAAIDTLIEVARGAAPRAGGRALIYTSGVWVLGNTRHPADEDAAVQPATIVSWRPAHEARVLKATGEGLRTAVIRPGIVYGGRRGIVSELFRDAANGLVRVIGSGQNHWPLVYDRDLAELYLRLAVLPDASGMYHATDEGDEQVNTVVEAIVSHANVRADVRHVPLDEARAKHGTFAEALALDQIVRGPRARALGWAPALRSVADNASRLFEEWRHGPRED